MKKPHLFIIVSLLYFTVWNYFAQAQVDQKTNSQTQLIVTVGNESFKKDNRTRSIFKQAELERQAEKLLGEGYYEEAIAKYQESMGPEYIKYDYDSAMARASIRKIHQIQGKYELALQELQWHLDRNPTKYEDDRLELLALIKARDTESPESIYDHIKYLKVKYLSPNGFRGDASFAISTIIRLYDYIADPDAGASFIDEILEYGYRENKDYIRVQTSAEAMQHGYKGAAEYLKIKQAFLQDKAEGKKGCLGAPPAKTDADVCIGRATKALIKSDYFPW